MAIHFSMVHLTATFSTQLSISRDLQVLTMSILNHMLLSTIAIPLFGIISLDSYILKLPRWNKMRDNDASAKALSKSTDC